MYACSKRANFTLIKHPMHFGDFCMIFHAKKQRQL